MTIASTPFNSVFRKEYDVQVYGPDQFSKGVIINDPIQFLGKVMVSVQRVSDGKTKNLAERGIVGKELKRLFGNTFMPMENEPLISSLAGSPSPTDFTITDTQNNVKVCTFYNPQLHGDLSGGNNSLRQPTAPAARIRINGVWYEVVDRIEMLNGVLSNYEFIVARVPINEQLHA